MREINLLGQNVNAYHGGDGWGLTRLIWALNDIDGLERIRFTTSHPNDMSDDLIAAHGECDKLMPYLHLPVQSGSDKVLKGMNRQHTAEHYIRLIERFRDACPDILISGDFIVGFPGEDDADFEATMDLIREVNYGQAYSFKYSARPGTPAAERSFVAADVANERLQLLQTLLTSQQRALQEAMVGKTVQVLVEKKGRMAGQMIGKSQHLHAVHIDEPSVGPKLAVGEIYSARITRSEANSLGGVLLTSP